MQSFISNSVFKVRVIDSNMKTLVYLSNIVQGNEMVI